jgi:prepilin signal peptidase PulO-like enzyme (type II secretory pathway)
MMTLASSVPVAWFLTGAFFYGLIIGSFLNVLIYRFHTGKSLSGHSHCLSCGTRLQWFELFPLFSYLGLRGRCRSCGSYIPSRYFLVELLTGLLFVVAAVKANTLTELLYLWGTLSVCVVIVVYDMRHFIIPDSLTLVLTIGALLWMGVLWYGGVSYVPLLVSVLAALGGVLFFYFLWFISKGQWIGFGDVKLAFPLGLMVSSKLVFSMIVFSFWIGAAVSLCLVGLSKLQRGKLCLRLGLRNLTIKSVVPFAPFLIAGCLFTLFTQLDVLTLFTFLY